jgi:hypothetical protein
VKALKEMRAYGYDVLLCGIPMDSCPTMASDMIKWVFMHFDTPDWVQRTIILTDKRRYKHTYTTLRCARIQADILIDDDPLPNKGDTLKYPTSWKHIVLDRPWNRFGD